MVAGSGSEAARSLSLLLLGRLCRLATLGSSQIGSAMGTPPLLSLAGDGSAEVEQLPLAQRAADLVGGGEDLAAGLAVLAERPDAGADPRLSRGERPLSV